MPQCSRVVPWVLVGLLCLINFPGHANAEYLGLVFGRSADPANQSELSMEAGVVSGQLGSVDFRYFGVRVNSRVAPNILVFGDFGSSEFGTADGRPYGLGALYHFNKQKFNPRLDIALVASYHSAGYSISDERLSITALSMEVIISRIATEGISGYVNFGYHQIDVKFGGLDARKELGFGAGVSLPLGSGEAYGGFNFIDEITLGLGFRYFIQPIEP